MKYKGIELTEFTSDRPVVFDPPKKMVVWDHSADDPAVDEIYAYLPGRTVPVHSNELSWQHCAEIPEEPKPRRATNRELAKWLAQGNGIFRLARLPAFWSSVLELKNDTCKCLASKEVQIRKWDDTNWHDPTVDYMGIENDKENQ